jgi:hypothetical protein
MVIRLGGRGRESGHVHAGLADDGPGCEFANAGDGRQPLTLVGERVGQLADPSVQLVDHGLEVVDMLQVQPAQDRVVFTEATGQGQG